jgi:UDP-N-acetylmuramate dehydrogenase
MFARVLPWLRLQGIAHQENAPIGPLLHFRIGGRVGLLVSCTTPDHLAACVQKMIAEKVPYLLVGGGSNIAFNDGLTRAAVLLFQSGARGPAAVRRLDGRTLQVAGGVKNQHFLSWCAAHGAGGLEFLSGIPGTLGGAAAVNAGAFGRSMADVLLGADIVDRRGRIAAVDAAYFAYSYRDSRFKLGAGAILSLRLQCRQETKAAVSAKIRENLAYRRANHPSWRLHSAGCFFKNPLVGGAKLSAGRILRDCGLQDLALGGLSLARAHANFLVNDGRATFAALKKMETKIRTAVKSHAGIALEREVIYVSARGKKY